MRAGFGLFVMLAPVLSSAQVHLEGEVSSTGGDYTLLPFDVPDGTIEIQVAHSDGSSTVILDWGLWSPSGFRGWGGGLTDDAIIGIPTSSRGYLPGALAAGSWTLVIGKAKLDGMMGHYSVDITFRESATLTPIPRAEWTARTLATGARWYRGDFHVHSVESGDARATFDQIVTLARSRHLDFVELSDHNTVSQIGREAAMQPDLSDLLFLRGIEVTTYHGHGNALGVSSYVDHRAGLGGVDATTILSAVRAQGGVFFVNHPTIDIGDACIGCAWTLDTPWDDVAAIEVHNGNYAISTALFTPSAIAMWDGLEGQGHRLAAVGGSDDHDAGMGTGLTASPIGSPTTLVFADALSEAAIIDGVKARHTQVLLRGPDEPAVNLHVGDAMVGDTTTAVVSYTASAKILGTPPDGAKLVLYRNGTALDSVDIAGADFAHDLTVTALGGRERVRAQVELEGKPITITSNIYVDGVTTAPDAPVARPDAPAAVTASDSGCDLGGGSGGLFLVLVTLASARRAWPGRRA